MVFECQDAKIPSERAARTVDTASHSAESSPIRTDKEFVRALLRQVEDLFDIAVAGTGSSAAIVLGRDGAFRMLDPAGWSLLALKEEFGASAVFKLERRAGRIRIEACDGYERCLVERAAGVSGNPAKAVCAGALQDRSSSDLELVAIKGYDRDARLGVKHYAHCSQNEGGSTVQQDRSVYL